MGFTYDEAKALFPKHAHEHPDSPESRAKRETVKRGKYGNSPTVHNGVRYHSKGEANRRRELDADPTVALVLDQPKFRLGVPENIYVADFLVIYRTDGGTSYRVEDYKGVETDKFRRDRKLWEAYGPCPLWVVRQGKIIDRIEPRRNRA